ncbi:hypothetical protein KSS87_019589 [Heliosperma pusillum]|nr:hypothetical protein KSS87_019589 [Heliosperma pusillum]
MGLRSKGKQLSFEILSSSLMDSASSSLMDRSISDDEINTCSRRRRKKKKNNKSNQTTCSESSSPMIPIAENSTFAHNYSNTTCSTSLTTTITGITAAAAAVVSEETETGGAVFIVSQGELRQRNVGGAANGETTTTTMPVYKEETADTRLTNGINGRKLETSDSLDWRQLIPDHPSGNTYIYLNCTILCAMVLVFINKQLRTHLLGVLVYKDPFPVENSPIKYFMEEMSSGNSLRSTTTPGDDKERERVYDTIFRLPWRCELLIDVGFFVCLNSFLSLLTIIPSRAAIILWRSVTKRQLKKLSAAELSDFGCILVLAGGIVLLGRTDISLIYHMIRGQGIIKLYVVYNVLELIWWSYLWVEMFLLWIKELLRLHFCRGRRWGGENGLVDAYLTEVNQYNLDPLKRLRESGGHNQEYMGKRIIHRRSLINYGKVSEVMYFRHFLILLKVLLAAHQNRQDIGLKDIPWIYCWQQLLQISFIESTHFDIVTVPSYLFSYLVDFLDSDSIERFHITAFVIFVLAQNIQEAEGYWFGNFISNALLVYLSEMAIDIIKHSFIAKFNDIKPITYSEFLEDLCKQTLNIQTDVSKRTLTFVPLAPACVVIRVLTPVYAARLPCNPIHWRFFWIFCLIALTYVMLVTLKVMVGMGLQKHAAWYVKRCQNRKLHSD